MRDLILLFVYVVTILIRLVRPGGVRAVLAESVLLRHQLLILNRSRHRTPNLRPSDRLIAGLCAILVLPRPLVRSPIVVKPSSLLNFHRAMVHRKYWLLFSAKRGTRPGPKGSHSDLIRAVVEMKQAIHVGDVHALPNRLPWPSISKSTPMAHKSERAGPMEVCGDDSSSTRGRVKKSSKLGQSCNGRSRVERSLFFHYGGTTWSNSGHTLL
jgi:hypothetical protein